MTSLVFIFNGSITSAFDNLDSISCALSCVYSNELPSSVIPITKYAPLSSRGSNSFFEKLNNKLGLIKKKNKIEDNCGNIKERCEDKIDSKGYKDVCSATDFVKK